jgi:uncharacterized protein YceH (UPF0502 family)
MSRHDISGCDICQRGALRDILAPVHLAPLTPPEQRVLGCLLEKRWTTPEQYPLTLNALRLACNQATNRDPVTEYDEATVREAAYRLSRYGLTRLATGHTSRATKYRHLAEEALGLERPELALLAVLLLRGSQTPGELKGRTERMHQFGTLEDVEISLSELGRQGYARRVPRRPGQKEDRFEQLLGGVQSTDAETPPPAAVPQPVPRPEPARDLGPERYPAPGSASAPPSADGLAAEVAALRDEFAGLAADVAALRDELAAMRRAAGAAPPPTPEP